MTLVGNLVDADAPQTGEPIDSLLGVSPDPSHDRPDGAPGDPHQFTPRFSSTPPPARPPCHRRQACARRDGAPTAPPPPSAHAPSSSPAAPRPPAPPAPFPNPGPATGASPRPGHRAVPDVRSGRNAATHRYAGAPAPPPARRPRPRRTQRPRSPCGGRHPTAHAITSHCARRCPLPWFLTLDKPETLSDNDVRLLSPKSHPRKCQKSRKTRDLPDNPTRLPSTAFARHAFDGVGPRVSSRPSW